MIGIGFKNIWTTSQVITDPEVRYVILKVKLKEQDIILIGVYAPNQSQSRYWEHLINTFDP